MPTRVNAQARKPFRKRSLLSSAIAIHVGALAVAIATNNAVDSVARASNLPVIHVPPASDDASIQEDTVLETSYSGSDYDDWVDDLAPLSETDELRNELSESPLELGPLENGIDTEFLDSDSPFTTAN